MTTSAATVECVFCSQQHELTSCTMETDVAKRRDLLMRTGRCFHCLKHNHMARMCHSTDRCNKCHRKHHPAICEGANGHQPSPKTANAYDTARSANGNQKSSNSTKATTSKTSAGTVGSGGGILLQTAKAVASSLTEPSATVTVRINLDGGSQQSLIRGEIRQNLKLKSTGQELLTANPFGGAAAAWPQQRDIVNVAIKTPDRSPVVISAVCVPSICAPLHHQYPAKVATLHSSIRDLPLANDCSGTAQMDILLGMDYYWQIVTGESVRTDNGPVAIKPLTLTLVGFSPGPAAVSLPEVRRRSNKSQ